MIDPILLVEQIAAVGAARAGMRAMVASGRAERDIFEPVLARLSAPGAIEGVEVHQLYWHGPHGLEVTDQVVLWLGAASMLMPDDVHGGRVPGLAPARLPQLYGLALARARKQEYAALVEQAWPAARAEAV